MGIQKSRFLTAPINPLNSSRPPPKPRRQTHKPPRPQSTQKIQKAKITQHHRHHQQPKMITTEEFNEIDLGNPTASSEESFFEATLRPQTLVDYVGQQKI